MVVSLIGRRLGRYTVVSELGRGQHSTVYKAWQPSLDRYVALKVLHHHRPETLQKFQAEARLTAHLIQQGVANIRQVYEVVHTDDASADGDGTLFVALEYVEDSLQSILRRTRARGHRMNPAAAARLLLPVAEALDGIHSLGWVHLDIKPQNILITKDGRAMLADFGIAQRRGTTTHACTPSYASPEQAAGDRPVGPWSDIYSLGAVLYEMVTGHPPVRGEHDIVLLNQHLEVMPPSPRRVNPQLSASQERAILRALAKPAKERYQTAGEFLQAVLMPETFLTTMIQTPGKVLNSTSGWFGGKSRLVLVGGILVLLIMILLVAGWVLWPLLAAQGSPTIEPGLVGTASITATAVDPGGGTVPTVAITRPATATVVDGDRATRTVRPTVTLMPRPTDTETPRPASWLVPLPLLGE